MTTNSHQPDCLTAMKRRGIDNPTELLAFATPAAILNACDWSDRRQNMGPGALAKLIREGGMPEPAKRRWTEEEQDDYWRATVAWVRKNFPQWDRDEGSGTHPAALSAVVRLHYRHGKGTLTVAEHGPLIVAAVQAWEQEINPQEVER